MRKNPRKASKLNLSRETLRQLDPDALDKVAAGATSQTVCMHTCADTCRCPTTSKRLTACSC